MMPMQHSGHVKQPGLAPGTLIYTGPPRDHAIHLEVYDYEPNEVRYFESATVESCAARRETPTTTWINVNGVHHVEQISDLGKAFGLHPLLLEDVLNVQQRPKLEMYDDHLFIVLKMLHRDAEGQLIVEHICLVLGEHYVISFQEVSGDVFDPVRQRLKMDGSRLRQRGTDYLAYALVDMMVDHFHLCVESIGNEIEEKETSFNETVGSEFLQEINNLKRTVLRLRRVVLPCRDVVGRISNPELPFFKDTTLMYIRDAHDHAVQAAENVETYREWLNNLADLYITKVGNQMNEVMKVLTLMGSIFIPLTFIVGVYGMNFDYMPELHWRYGYTGVWVVMILVGVGTIGFFKWKKWM